MKTHETTAGSVRAGQTIVLHNRLFLVNEVVRADHHPYFYRFYCASGTGSEHLEYLPHEMVKVVGDHVNFGVIKVYRYGGVRSSKRSRRLYEWGSYASTERLGKLLDGEIGAKYHDIFELFNMFHQGCQATACSVEDTKPRLKEFAKWILDDNAEVGW